MYKEEDDDIVFQHPSIINSTEVKTIRQFTQVIPYTFHYFYITDEIEEIDPYINMINVLRTSDPNTTINILVSCPGGSLYSAIQIINAIRDSQATVITILDGLAASAASLILLTGHKIVINKNSSLMIHNYSQSIGSTKGNELILHVEYQKKYFKALAEDIYGDFLTKTELNELLNNGRDYWFNSEEVIDRLKKKNKILTRNQDVKYEKKK